MSTHIVYCMLIIFQCSIQYINCTAATGTAWSQQQKAGELYDFTQVQPNHAKIRTLWAEKIACTYHKTVLCTVIINPAAPGPCKTALLLFLSLPVCLFTSWDKYIVSVFLSFSHSLFLDWTFFPVFSQCLYRQLWLLACLSLSVGVCTRSRAKVSPPFL